MKKFSILTILLSSLLLTSCFALIDNSGLYYESYEPQRKPSKIVNIVGNWQNTTYPNQIITFKNNNIVEFKNNDIVERKTSFSIINNNELSLLDSDRTYYFVLTNSSLVIKDFVTGVDYNYRKIDYSTPKILDNKELLGVWTAYDNQNTIAIFGNDNILRLIKNNIVVLETRYIRYEKTLYLYSTNKEYKYSFITQNKNYLTIKDLFDYGKELTFKKSN